MPQPAEKPEKPEPPDPALKGVKGGNCNRTDCQKPGAVWFNWGMNKYYCGACALRINEYPVNGSPLCSRDAEAVTIVRAARRRERGT